MKGIALQSNAPDSLTQVVSGTHRDSTYQKVKDGRKRPIRGLWIRNGRFYAQLTIEDSNTGTKSVRRVPLIDSQTNEPVSTAAQAVAQLGRLKVQRRDNVLPVLKQTPKFNEYADNYLAYFSQVKDAKRPSTVAKEKSSLKLWQAHLKDTRIDRIKRVHINDFIAKRQSEGSSARTVNLDVIALRNVLKRAIDDEWIKVLPTVNMRPLKVATRKRELVSSSALKTICEAAFSRADDGHIATKNAQQFVDYIWLMAFCGSRRNETLRLKWTDVDFKKKQITIGADGSSKNHEFRVVDFNMRLEKHLKDMHRRRVPDSQWLFPSPQRGERDVPAKTFKESLNASREKSGLRSLGFHDCRHFFISMAVMSGVDFMTIAKWVGHKDGGILIGKVYGHLSDEHAKRQAAKLTF